MLKRFVSLLLVVALIMTNVPVIAEGGSAPSIESIEVTPTPEAAAEPEVTVEPTAEHTAELTTELIAIPTESSVPEASAMPEADSSTELIVASKLSAAPDPTTSVVPLTLDMLQTDQSLVSVGEDIRWTFVCEGSEQITYAIVNHRQETVASGDVGKVKEIIYTPIENGCYTLSVIATTAEATLKSESVAYVSAGELDAMPETDQRYAVVDHTELNYCVSVEGGVAPYTVCVTVMLEDSTLYEETYNLMTAENVALSYMPTTFGDHEVHVALKDAVGTECSVVATLPVAVLEWESQSQWEDSISSVSLTGDWRNDLVSVAEMQLGYKESERNFLIDESGAKKGYTRFGDWKDAPYEDWSALLIAFSLYYANIPETWVPQCTDCNVWKNELLRIGAYENNDGYTPERGDIIFFDLKKNGEHVGYPNHIGVVTNVSGNTVSTIEGDVEEAVCCQSYNLSDSDIVGYGNMRIMMERAGILEESGDNYLWYKATADGVTEEIPYEETDPVIINESGALVSGNFQYKVIEDGTGAIITKYMGADDMVLIPSTVSDLLVVEIGASAFKGNTLINKIVVPDGTTEISSKAFANSSMTELVLPDSLTFIAEDAFEGCGELVLTVPGNCYAYDRCVELGLIAASNVTYIGESGFEGCDSPTDVTISCYDGTGAAKRALENGCATVYLAEETYADGWNQIDGQWYYYENGAALTERWMKDSTGWCYLGADGAMVTNAWVMDSKGWCYLGGNGYAVTNCWKQDSVGWCYLDGEGSMVKSAWVQTDGKWYFLDEYGYRVTNSWRQDSTGWCYLGSDGAMVTNAWVMDSKGWCYLGENGYAVTNCWKQDSVGWCNLDSEGSMTKNEWVTTDGKTYYLNSDGYRATSTWVEVSGKWYYLDENGCKVTNAWRQDSIG